MLKMIDCEECVWEETCNAHRGGVIACPAGKRKPEAWELPEVVIDPTVVVTQGYKDYTWPLDQIEAFKAAYAR